MSANKPWIPCSSKTLPSCLTATLCCGRDIARGDDRGRWIDHQGERARPFVSRSLCELGTFHSSRLPNALLQINDRLNQLLRARWATGDIDIDRQEPVDA